MVGQAQRPGGTRRSAIGFWGPLVSVGIVAVLLTLPSASGFLPGTSATAKPPYSGATATFASSGGGTACARGLVKSAPQWSPTTGRAKTGLRVSDHICHTVNGSAESDSSAFSSFRVSVPIHLAKSGAHGIREVWTLRLNTTSVFTTSGCPAKNISFDPNQPEVFSGCADRNTLFFSIQSEVVDLNNSSWSQRWQDSNQSFFSYTNLTGWQNTTDCGVSDDQSNGGCVNTTGRYQNPYSTSFNVAGFARFTPSGQTHLVLWSNASNMSQRDSFVVVTTLNVEVRSDLSTFILVGHWKASASASLDMGTSGFGAWLDSIVVT
jgi:hypothetical protein